MTDVDTQDAARPSLGRLPVPGPPAWALAAIVVLACLPTLSTAFRIAPEWLPVGDTAAITLRSHDVPTGESPLVGMPTTLSDSVGRTVHHPGPLEFWAIAAGRAVVDHRAMPLVAVTLVNLLAIGAIVVVARRMAGTAGALLAGTAVALCCWSLRGDYLVDPYNPYAAWLPLAAFAVALAATLRGHLWALLVAVPAGSYAAQSHVSLVIPVAVTTVVATVVAAALDLGPDRPLRSLPGRVIGAVRERSRLALTVVVVAVVCWAPVLLDLVAGRQNLVTLARASGTDARIVGGQRAWQMVVGVLTDPPWLEPDRLVFEVVVPMSGARQLAAVALIALAVAVAVGTRRGAPVVTATLVVAMGGLAGGLLAASRIPDGIFSTFALHNYFWMWPFTAMFWVGLIGGLAWMAVDHLAGTETARRRAVTAGAVIALVPALVVGIVSVVEPPVRSSGLAGRAGPAASAVGEQVGEEFASGDRVLVRIGDDLDQALVSMALVLELERRGVVALVEPRWGASFGAHRVHHGDTPLTADLSVAVSLSRPDESVAADGDLIASFDPTEDTQIELAGASAAMEVFIRDRGGLVADHDTRSYDGAALTEVVSSGELVGLQRFYLVHSPQLAGPVFDRYASAHEGPVLWVRVYRR